jgi:hypothetical protein
VTNLEIFLLTVFVVLLIWQSWLLWMAGQYVRAGYSNVKFGILPGLLAIPAGVALLVVTR